MLRDLVSRAPTRLPIWLMDCSEPRVNRANARDDHAGAHQEGQHQPRPYRTKNRHSTLTISAMGKTESTASRSFSTSTFFWINSLLFLENLRIA